MVCERSYTGSSRMEPGSPARKVGRRFFTVLATSTALEPACRDTASTTVEPGGLAASSRTQK